MSEPRTDWQFGDLALSRIIESEMPLLSPFEIFGDCDRSHITRNLSWLAPRFYDSASDLLVIAIQSFLIRNQGMTILVDTCSGNDKDRVRPVFDHQKQPWLERLRQAGVEPRDVDIVMCTHLHVDHVGWNTCLENGRWVATFANARYLISHREWEYWRRESSATRLPRTGDYIRDSVLPIFEAGQAELISDDYALDTKIWLEPAPGHTPGHFVIHLFDGGREAILCGDLVHHPLQLRYPEWSTRFCADPDQARETRQRFLADYARSDTMLLPAHFPSPSGIYIDRVRDHYTFRFCDEPERIVMET